MTYRKTFVRGVGAYLPERIMTNDEMSRIVDTSDEWISARTGIRQRHIAAVGEYTSDIATHAARAALENAGVKVEDVDLIIVATTTPDHTFPATATQVQANLAMTHGAAFDLQAVCSGFVFALSTADAMIRARQADTVIVIGAETFSRILDWTDRTTCVLFGDGGGAVVLQAGEGEASDGVIGHEIRTDGRQKELLYVDGGPSTTQTVGHVRMIGNQVFRHAVQNIASSVRNVVERAGVSVGDIDWFVPHQANQRILEGVAKRLGLDEGKVVSTVSRHGNTSAASIPLALTAAVQDGRIKKGQLVLIEAMGGGFSWGASLFRL